MVRYRLSVYERDLISDLFPEPTGVGRPPNNPRDMMDGIRWILRTGAPWRDVPEEIGEWSSVWDTFDRQGHPLAARISPGQEHESQTLVGLLESVDVANHDGKLVPLPEKLATDKGYRSEWVDEHLLELGIRPDIPSKANLDREERVVEFDRDAFRSRNMSERLVGWLKEGRRILARFEKIAKYFLGMIRVDSVPSRDSFPRNGSSLAEDRNLPSILTWFRDHITIATTEGFNSRIQAITANARGFTNFQNYRTRILFYRGRATLLQCEDEILTWAPK